MLTVFCSSKNYNSLPLLEKFSVFKKIAETGMIRKTLAFDISVANI